MGAAAATFVVFALTPDYANEIIGHVLSNPIVFFFELLISAVVIYLLYYAVGQAWLAVGSSTLLIYAMCIIHKYKVYLRGDPFMPADLILSGEVLNITQSSSVQIGLGSAALFVLIALGVAAAAVFFRFKRAGAAERVIGVSAAAVVAAICYFFVFTNESVYMKIPIKHNMYNMVNEFNSKGFLYAFIYHTKDLDLRSLRPEGYSVKEAQDILDRYSRLEAQDMPGPGHGARPGAKNLSDYGARIETQDVPDHGARLDGAASPNILNDAASSFRPDVIFLMSEAFWDIKQISSLSFGEDVNPTPNFDRLAGECVSGELYVSVYGGGTDATEFSILTGHSMPNFGKEISSAFKFFIRRDTDSIARTFARAGYSTVALHPGYPWFYNRANVYTWLGFDRFIDIGSFNEAEDVSGNYISDEAMTDKLMDIYSEYTGGGGRPFFNFTVSIQNHGPYDGGLMYGPTEINYSLDDNIVLSEKSAYAVTNFIKGISDADRSLGRLIEFFSASDRPVILVFFGDHLPGLGKNFAAYHELGYPIGFDGGFDEKVNVYRERYLIWANEEARSQWPGYEGLLNNPLRMGANCLGVYVIELTGLPRSPYENLVANIRENLPVYHSMFYGTDGYDGGVLYEIKPPGYADGMNDVLKKIINEYKITQYYKLFDEKKNFDTPEGE